MPQIEVAFDPDRAQQVGVTPAAVRETVATMVRGTKVGEVFDAQKIFDVVVWGTPDVRHDLFALRRLPVELPAGGYVAARRRSPTCASRRRRTRSRVRAARAASTSRATCAAATWAPSPATSRPRWRRVPFESGYHAEVLGEYAARAESQRRLLMLGAVSLAVHPAGAARGLRVDADGGAGRPHASRSPSSAAWSACVLTGGVLSLGSLVGFVTVLGIAARNGIMLVSHYRHLEHEEGMPFGPELVLRGAEERLSPILMTALVTGLALVPIILGGDRSGHEIEHPMAVVILGGLVTSTILNVFLLPAIYLRFGQARVR